MIEHYHRLLAREHTTHSVHTSSLMPVADRRQQSCVQHSRGEYGFHGSAPSSEARPLQAFNPQLGNWRVGDGKAMSLNCCCCCLTASMLHPDICCTLTQSCKLDRVIMCQLHCHGPTCMALVHGRSTSIRCSQTLNPQYFVSSIQRCQKSEGLEDSSFVEGSQRALVPFTLLALRGSFRSGNGCN
eukprot:1144730-Pelagomonas_calceolata.AAC.3